jgi:uncharacterized protein (TIGR02301 family)
MASTTPQAMACARHRRSAYVPRMVLRALSFAVAFSILAAAGSPSRAIDGGPAPFDGDLQRLAEILGALHYLRGICGSNEGQKWRSEMQALLDAEAPSGERHNRLVVSFNRGYRGFQQTYRTCTPAADVVIRRYLDEGSKIAREITARYSN